MGRRLERASGKPIEHVADVADKCSSERRRVDPSTAGSHLQATMVVLSEQRQQSVVGMFAYTPFFFVCRSLRWITEDAEKYGRIGGIRSRKILGVEAKRERDALHQSVRGSDCRTHVGFDRSPKVGYFVRPQIGAMKR